MCVESVVGFQKIHNETPDPELPWKGSVGENKALKAPDAGRSLGKKLTLP